MSQQPRHRGAHPEDEGLFADSQVATLRAALHDYCWLLSRGYAIPSTLKLVGDRFQLVDRQRLLLMRAGCTDAQLAHRSRTRRPPSALVGRDVYLDGFNTLITIESALSHGVIYLCQDGCYRDLASVHGTYKRVQETHTAITLIGETLATLHVPRTAWLLDKPVSNSGRLQQLLLEIARDQGWNWEVTLCSSPDAELKRMSATIVSTDSAILDAVEDWFHLNQQVIEQHLPDTCVMDLRTANTTSLGRAGG